MNKNSSMYVKIPLPASPLPPPEILEMSADKKLSPPPGKSLNYPQTCDVREGGQRFFPQPPQQARVSLASTYHPPKFLHATPSSGPWTAEKGARLLILLPFPIPPTLKSPFLKKGRRGNFPKKPFSLLLGSIVVDYLLVLQSKLYYHNPLCDVERTRI